MILAACGGRGNEVKDAEGLARAESREGSGKWEVGRVDRKEGGWGGVDGNGETGRGNLEGGNGGGGYREGESGRRQRGGGDGMVAVGTGREWQWGGGMR